MFPQSGYRSRRASHMAYTGPCTSRKKRVIVCRLQREDLRTVRQRCRLSVTLSPHCQLKTCTVLSQSYIANEAQQKAHSVTALNLGVTHDSHLTVLIRGPLRHGFGLDTSVPRDNKERLRAGHWSRHGTVAFTLLRLRFKQEARLSLTSCVRIFAG